MNKTIFLSYILDSNTPSYGNRNKFIIKKKSSIENDDVANDSFISTTVHIGTHIDMPYHFYEDGQTIDDFSADFWIFLKEEILFLEIDTSSIELAIKDVLLRELKNTKDRLGEFWSKNFGFHPDIYNYLIENFPNVKVFGFDSISVSSFSNRMLGREAHKRFLNPNRPILLLEDMDLRKVCSNTIFQEVIIAPLRIARCDGLPCTVIGRI